MGGTLCYIFHTFRTKGILHSRKDVLRTSVIIEACNPLNPENECRGEMPYEDRLTTLNHATTTIVYDRELIETLFWFINLSSVALT
jgi:hypothetical protein